ncbi:MAG: hypothetical protein OEW08_12805, partial [Gammaproteobacteria bacterium]|nr:hypothetical protein [Gammaproteobacteria bacterium]
MTDMNFEITTGETYKAIGLKPAIILFPSLMTPLILSGDDDVEILLLGKNDNPLDADAVNWQLKLGNGINWSRSYRFSPLYKPEDIAKKITLKKLGAIDDENTIHATNKLFNGMLSNWAIDAYNKEGFDTLYSITIASAKEYFSEGQINNIFWLTNKLKPVALMLDSADPNATYKMNSDIKDKQGEWVVPTAIADQIIAKTARELFSAFWT